MYLPARAECQLVPQAAMLMLEAMASSSSEIFISPEEDFAGVEGDAAQSGVGDGARLLPDFLEHEVLVAALFSLDGIPLDAGDGALDRVAVKIGEGDAGQGEDGHVAVGEEVDVARMVEDAGDVGGDEVLAFADADNHWRAEAGDDDLVRLKGREHAQREGAGEALDGAADGDFQGDGLTGDVSILLHLFNQVGDDLGVRLGDEFVALSGEFALQLEIVFNDSVVYDDDAPGAVAMGVGVLFGGASVGGPAGVADAEGAIDGMLDENLFEVGQLAGGAAHLEGGTGWRADGDARRVIAAIFQAPQPFDDDRDYLLGTNITDNSAHATILNEAATGESDSAGRERGDIHKWERTACAAEGGGRWGMVAKQASYRVIPWLCSAAAMVAQIRDYIAEVVLLGHVQRCLATIVSGIDFTFAAQQQFHNIDMIA